MQPRVQQALRTEVAQRLAGVEASTQPPERRRRSSQPICATRRRRSTLLETRIAESQAQQAALEALYRDLAPSRDEIALSEIEQVLLVANQQLQLAGNVRRRSLRCSSPTSSCSDSTARSSFRCAARCRATWIG